MAATKDKPLHLTPDAWRHRARIARMRRLGMSQTEISKKLGLSQATICLMLQKIDEYYRDQAERDTREVLADILQDLAWTKKEAMLAWEKSKKPAKIASTKKVTKPSGGNGASDERSEASVRQENRDGDPRYLDVVLRVLAECKDLFGLDKAKAIHAEWETENARLMRRAMDLGIIDAIPQSVRDQLQLPHVTAEPASPDPESESILDRLGGIGLEPVNAESGDAQRGGTGTDRHSDGDEADAGNGADR